MGMVMETSRLPFSEVWMRPYLFFPVLLLMGVMLVTSCSHLTQKSANDVFQQDNPTFTIVHSEPGEGWSDVVYYHFYYKKPDDPKTYEYVYCFEYRHDKWEITSRYEPK